MISIIVTQIHENFTGKSLKLDPIIPLVLFHSLLFPLFFFYFLPSHQYSTEIWRFSSVVISIINREKYVCIFFPKEKKKYLQFKSANILGEENKLWEMKWRSFPFCPSTWDLFHFSPISAGLLLPTFPYTVIHHSQLFWFLMLIISLCKIEIYVRYCSSRW